MRAFLVAKLGLMVGKSYKFYFAAGSISIRAMHRKGVGMRKTLGALLNFILTLHV